MDRGGDSGADDWFGSAGDPAGSDPSAGPPPGAAQRQWAHPSEVGMQARVHTDRRRSRLLVVGLVAVGVTVLVGTATVTSAFSDAGTPVASGGQAASLADSLAMVQVPGGGSDHTTGVLVDGGHHLVLAADGLRAIERVAVQVDGQRTAGTVVAHDSYMNLVIVELESPAGSQAVMSPDPTRGEELRLVRFDDDGERSSTPARVVDVSMVWFRADHTVADGLIALSGSTADTGVLVKPDGTVAGLVIGAYDGHPVAYPASTLQRIVDELRRGGRIDHPWIGVRVRNPEAGEISTRSTVIRSAVSVPTTGAVVTEVVAGSPAQAAGVRTGDVIYAVNGAPVIDITSLVTAVAPLTPGEAATVSLIRSGTTIDLTVEVTSFPG